MRCVGLDLRAVATAKHYVLLQELFTKQGHPSKYEIITPTIQHPPNTTSVRRQTKNFIQATSCSECHSCDDFSSDLSISYCPVSFVPCYCLTAQLLAVTALHMHLNSIP